MHRTRGGGSVVWFTQVVDGLEVYPARVSVLVAADGALVAVGGRPHELPTPAARGDVRPDEAVAIALSDLFETPIDAALLSDAGPRADGWRGWTLAPGAEVAAGLAFREEARTRSIWTPTPWGLIPAFRVEVQARSLDDDDQAWAYLIDASSGAVLRRVDLVHDGSFRVWLTDDLRPEAGPEEDYLPHPTGVPQSGFPAYVAPALVEVTAFNTNPDGESDPWLPPDATTLSSNNVDVYLDLSAPSGFGAGDHRPSTSTPGVFDALYDPTLAPNASDAQLSASAQPVFVLANWLHDWYYDAGFVEAVGNAQVDNFGRGGWGGDPVVVEAQDYGFGGAANMLVPGDGASPRLQVGNWPGSPNRPGALDATIVGHEWIHHMHLRLVYCLASQCIAESEGWSDFLALHMLLDEGDDLDGSYAIATYAARQISLDSAYFGARRYPYSASFANNPLTLRHIGQSAALPTSAPRNPFTGGTNNEVHRAGEVWAQMLWQAYTELLRDTLGPTPRLSWDEARRRMSEYAVTAMMLAPVDPSYTEQRDVLLAAAREVDADDFAAFARGFAARGAGTCAVGAARESSSFDDVVEGFEVAAIPVVTSLGIDDGLASCDGDGALDAGEVGRARFRVANLGAVPITGATLSVVSAVDAVTLPDGGVVPLDDVPAGGERVVEVPVALDAGAVGPVDAVLELTLTTPSVCDGEQVYTVSALVSYERVPASTFVETVELDAAGWTAAGTSGVWSIRRLAPGDHAFHGADSGRQTAARLISPPMTVAPGAALSVALRHAYRFEADMTGDGPTYYDGGIIEVSTNGGGSWQDVANLTTSPYPGTIVNGSSPLGGRAAFVGESPAYPELEALTLDLGDSFGGKTVRLAFTIVTDAFVGDAGWLVDDVAVSGLVAPPFDAAVAAVSPEVFADGDDDGFGAGIGAPLCPVPDGYAALDGDCEDGDDAIFPGATEACNGADDDCDGDTDEALSCDDPGPESAAEPGPEQVVEPGPEPIAEPGPEPVVEPGPEPIADDEVVEDVDDADVAEAVEDVDDTDVIEVYEDVDLTADTGASGDTDEGDGATAVDTAPTADTAPGADTVWLADTTPEEDTAAGEDVCTTGDCAPDTAAQGGRSSGCSGGGGAPGWALWLGLLALLGRLRGALSRGLAARRP